MRHFLVTVLATLMGVVAAVALLVVLAIMAATAFLADWVRAENDPSAAHSGSLVLEIDLQANRLDQPTTNLLPSSGSISLIELVSAIEAAGQDDDVAGLFIRAGAGVTPSDAEEIRRALLAFKQTGKNVTAHIQSLASGSTSPYLAVSAAEEIWMHPSGWFAVTGLRTEQLFVGEALTRLGAEAQFLQLYEYKGAAEIFTRAGFSDETRQATEAWLHSLFETAISYIAQDRQMVPERAQQLLSQGPYLAREAVELDLVDGLAHVEEARARALLSPTQSHLISIDEYARHRGSPQTGAVIALITGQGPVVDGRAMRGLAVAQTLASDTVAEAIDTASSDTKVQAIVLRLDTGGGSATASDQIAAAILRARQRGIPVVVSMGAVAASGGYYMAAPADHITANAGTITGSIGVVSGKVSVERALERVGISVDSVTAGGEFTGALSPIEGFSEAQRAAIQTWAEATYVDFTALVAEGRDLPLARVETLARGRVWTGAQALELGLVDEIGGFTDAVATARRLAGVSPDETIQILPYPAAPKGLERLRLLMSSGVEIARSAQSLSTLVERPEVQAILRETQTRDEPVALEVSPAGPD